MRRSSLPIFDTLKVASPCSADWEQMFGDDRRRFCGACEKFVYNVELLDPQELVELIETTEGKFCGRLYQRTDGTVLTGDCPIGLSNELAALRRRRFAGAAGAVAALVLAAGGYVLASSWGGASIHSMPPMVAGEIAISAPPEPPDDPAPVLMGKIAIEPRRGE